DRVIAHCAAPDGTLIAIDDDNAFITFDGSGRRLSTQSSTTEWCVVGWNGAQPIVVRRNGAAWVAPYVYSWHDSHLHRLDADGALLAATAIPREPFDTLARALPEIAHYPPGFRFPYRLGLAYDAHTDRFVATHWGPVAWLAAIQLDGTIDWAHLL